MTNKIDKKDNWYLERWSNFTASECWKLLKLDKEGQFMQTALTYIETKAIEAVTEMQEKPKLEFVEPLLFGKAHEAPAFYYYQKVTRNNSMRYFGSEEPVYLKYNNFSGGSPDALMGQDTVIKWGAEIKCPYNSANHWKYLKFKNQWDLKEQRFEYYCQIQFLLMITKAEGFHYVSFDDRFKEPKLKIKIIEVLPDKKLMDKLDVILNLAEKKKQEMIKEVLNVN